VKFPVIGDPERHPVRPFAVSLLAAVPALVPCAPVALGCAELGVVSGDVCCAPETFVPGSVCAG
jgi:hypothetical protein